MTEKNPAVERLDGSVTHTHIGGQAVIEGVMMRGKYNWAVAVRAGDGTIHTEEHDLVSSAAKHNWMRWPIVRGVVALVETLALAMKAFTVSAELMGETEEEKLTGNEIGLSMLLGLVLAVGLFIVLPAVLTNLMIGSAADRPFVWNLIDGLLRVVMFFLYIWAISRMNDIQRVFGYHGAEHKVIHAFEHGLDLEPEGVQSYSTMHVRCGTSFLLMVMIVAILVFSLVPVRAIAAAMGSDSKLFILGVTIASRLILLPLVAGLAYEITVKWAGSHADNAFVKSVLWPGLQLQRMTTREPDDAMVEVAIAAVKPVIARERREAGLEVASENVTDSDVSGDDSTGE